ncbi:MAG: LysR family transcriptional regulator [Raineya sp.]|jgi:DNA-binding transcriptional LysR family regulator|nr:LysR family transcriptional regulator [Raineya sp.]
MNYTLNQLEIFLKVAHYKSVTKAAEELHLTQPAVSIQLKNFQDQFDIPLTETIGRKIFITEFGKEIAEAAQNILHEVAEINQKTLAYKRQLGGRLTISVVSTGKYVMPYFLTDFLKKYQGVELVMDVTNKAQVIESLEKNEVDFSLVSILPENMSLHTIELLENKLFLIGSGGVEIDKNLELLSILEQMPLIYRENGSGTRLTMERFLMNHQVKSYKKLELTSNEAVKQAILAGLGVSIMPIIGIKNELLSGELKIIPIKGLPIKTTWELIWLKRKKLSPVAQMFTTYLQEHKSEIVRKYFNFEGFK